MVPVGFALTEQEFLRLMSQMSQVFTLDAELPGWVFASRSGLVDFCEYETALSGDFERVLIYLAAHFGDSEITVVMSKPSLAQLRPRKGSWPAFTIAASSIAPRFYDLLNYWAGEGCGSIVLDADEVLVTGTTRSWGLFADRGWGMALLWADTDRPSWRSTESFFVGPADALRSFAEQNVGAGQAFDRQDLEQFEGTYTPHSAM